MSLKTHLRDFRKRFLTTMFISKVTLILLNVSFITLDLTISTLVWLDIYSFPAIKVDLPEPELESIVATKKCGIVLTSLLVVSICSIGLYGAIRGNSNLLITYDVIGLITILVLLFGWRNYTAALTLYWSVIGALLTALLVALVYIKTIKDEPYRIRRELMMVNMASMRESIFCN